jgi:hypothetical protein
LRFGWTLCVLAVAGLATACRPAGRDAPRGAPPAPAARTTLIATPARAPAAFPLTVAPAGRHLVDSKGVPFRIQGDAAWSLIANLTPAEAETYLDDRRAKGFNTLIVNLIEHHYAADAPRNRAGVAPFRTPGDLSTPDDAYFDHAVSVVAKARARGLLVLLVPAYLGYGCPLSPSPKNEGWSAELARSSTEACHAYGRYVGKRFRDLNNVLWMQGGDCTPPPGSVLEACSLQILDGLRETGPPALETAHWSPNTLATDEAALTPALQLNAVYQYLTPLPACRRAYARVPVLPASLVESGYENETNQGSSPPERKYLYWGSLGCIGGVVAGNRPIWLFDKGWQAALDSPANGDMVRLGQLLDALPWQDLVPSGLAGMRDLVPAGGGRPGDQDEVAAAATRDGRALLAYLPPGWRGERAIAVDLSVLSGPATARWYDPSTGAWQPIGPVSNDGRRWFTTPAAPASADNDWVLVVTR